ncbi:type 4a pilus biogenesis protein PilO [Eikenella sp. S3360]|uniref:Type 4a pilus biogenesis protein PilO n=1 Tax=Eikenella glucosivorans TaxID=2766967 RepID=A0ABS0NBK0_9NEIS|nr:type 4a pilus biogenesis protein PilO [Eikenella glucosivorans]MBH5329684.1 type 4a pilus biogenesis protein PilO [Eikenella glucosivorans]
MAQNFDLNTLYKQNKLIQLGAGIAIVVLLLTAGYFALFQSQWEELGTLEQKEEELKTEYQNKANQAANLPVLKDELEKIRTAFNVLLKQLPTDAEIPNLIQELHQAGAKNSMRMNSVKPLDPIDLDNVQQLPYEISISGNYEQIAQFVRDVGRLSRIVTLDKINLVPSDAKDSNGLLTLTANANTYKALAPSETAAASAVSQAE